MVQEDYRKKKKSPLGTIVVVAAIAMFALAGEVSEAVDTVIGLIIVIGAMVLPIVFVVSLVKAVKRTAAKSTASGVHTHDRIDHSRDLKINTQTGKAERPITQAVQHSPREHWKQQLDGLLANGTIDRAEYRALMKRKF